jgi:RimJ/RimL family protein N-acetyltransferase
MTDIVSTLLWQWAVPRMGVRRVLVQIIVDNRGSMRVLQSSGFTLTKVVENYEEARGKMIDFAFFEWKLDAGDTQLAKL